MLHSCLPHHVLWFYFDPVSLLKSILLWKTGKFLNSDHTYHYSNTITQKSIWWLRLQIVTLFPYNQNTALKWKKKKLEHCTKVSKTHYLTSARASPYNQFTEKVKDWANRPLIFSRMQQTSPDETSMMTKPKHFGLLMCHDSH